MSAGELPVVVYSTQSEIRNPVALLRAMLHDLGASRELAWRLFVRDLQAMYRKSALGILWGFVPPLVTAGIFVVLERRGVVQVGPTPIPYPAFVLVGTVLWQTFVEAIHAPLKALAAARPLLAKVNFPREALLLSAAYEVAFGFLLKLLVLAAVFAWFRILPPPAALAAPVGVAALIGLGLMFGLLLAPLGALYNDVGSALLVATQLWFFVTPVVYPVPQSFPFSLIGVLNPVAPILTLTRDLATLGRPGPLAAAVCWSLFTLAGLLAGWVLYRLAMPIVIERTSA